MKKSLISKILFSISCLAAFAGCTPKKAELGSLENPIKMLFVPSVDSQVIEDNSKKFQQYLEKNTPYKYEISIPQSFAAVVEAFGTQHADVAAINTLGYVLANKKYGAQARLTVIRNGSDTYQSEFIVKAGGPIKSVEALANKKIAFVDVGSMSGYILPLKTLKDKKIEPKEIVFAGDHEKVVSLVYKGEVDAGATFYSPPVKTVKGEEIQDARHLVLGRFPDVEKKVTILSLSETIKNDPIVFRKEMPEEMKKQIVEAMEKFVQTAEGVEAFKAIYGVTGIKPATDADYDSVRNLLKGKNIAELMQKK